MAPSQSNPEQVSKVIHQIVFLLDTIDNKVLIAYHDFIAAKVRSHAYTGMYDDEYALLQHIFGLKIVLQNRRRERQKLNEK